MVPTMMKTTPRDSSLGYEPPWLMAMMPRMKRTAPLLRMRTLATWSLASRLSEVCSGLSQRGPSAREAWQWGQVLRRLTTAEPQLGHLRVRAIGVRLEGTQVAGQ